MNYLKLMVMNNDRRNRFVVNLSNGVRIANFSSPHIFTFTDERVLPACTKEHSEAMEISDNERLIVHDITNSIEGEIECYDVILNWSIPEGGAVDRELSYWVEQWTNDKIDIVIVPLPVMIGMKKQIKDRGDDINIEDTPFRVVRMATRDPKRAHIDRFCI